MWKEVKNIGINTKLYVPFSKHFIRKHHVEYWLEIDCKAL